MFNCVYECIIHQSLNGHMLCFWLLVLESNTALEHDHTNTYFSFYGYILRSLITGIIVALYKFFRSSETVIHSSCLILQLRLYKVSRVSSVSQLFLCLLLFVCLYLCLCVYAMCPGAHGCQKHPLLLVLGCYESPDMDSGNWTQVLWRSRKHF